MLNCVLIDEKQQIREEKKKKRPNIQLNHISNAIFFVMSAFIESCPNQKAVEHLTWSVAFPCISWLRYICLVPERPPRRASGIVEYDGCGTQALQRSWTTATKTIKEGTHCGKLGFLICCIQISGSRECQLHNQVPGTSFVRCPFKKK